MWYTHGSPRLSILCDQRWSSEGWRNGDTEPRRSGDSSLCLHPCPLYTPPVAPTDPVIRAGLYSTHQFYRCRRLQLGQQQQGDHLGEKVYQGPLHAFQRTIQNSVSSQQLFLLPIAASTSLKLNRFSFAAVHSTWAVSRLLFCCVLTQEYACSYSFPRLYLYMSDMIHRAISRQWCVAMMP
jgi:hypothetical protein